MKVPMRKAVPKEWLCEMNLDEGGKRQGDECDWSRPRICMKRINYEALMYRARSGVQ